jgi:hypothetical protein
MTTATTTSADVKDIALVVDDLEVLRVLGNPHRARIVGWAMADPDMTFIAADAAAMLDIKTTNVYYHLRLLEDAQLLDIAGTRLVNGIMEKHYRAAGRVLRFDGPGLGLPIES